MCEAFLSLYIRTIEMKLLLVSRNLRLIGGKIGVNYKLQVLVLNEKVKRQVARSNQMKICHYSVKTLHKINTSPRYNYSGF